MKRKPAAPTIRDRACCWTIPIGVATNMPRSEIVRFHDEKLLLCEAIETIADELPRRVDRLRCLMIASSLIPLLRTSHGFEETALFPRLVARGNDEVVARLKAEHLEDDCAAQDLTETLLAIGHGRGIENPEAFGYMLRGFFDALRRHIRFERHLLRTSDEKIVVVTSRRFEPRRN